MIGRVGADLFGNQLKENLQAAGVDTSHVWSTPGESTGVALISVEAGGQNQIVVSPGANGCLSPHDVKTAFASLNVVSPRYLLMQLESPIETVETAAALGRNCGMVTVLDPAPARMLSLSLLENIDLLTPNETEALFLLGDRGGLISLDEAPAVTRRLLKLGPRQVILKLGEKGAWWADSTQSLHIPVMKVEPVDTTAAGDTFNGALAVALAEGCSVQDAIGFANYAAAVSVTRFGAQASIPARTEVEAFLKS
jgi:ribokinase